MANTINSPNMSLPVPVVGTDPGPQYAIDINSCLAILDAHTHASGSGALITPAAININSALTFAGNLATNVGAVTFLPQVSDPAVGSIYEKGVDLYYIDGSSNVIRITQSGAVAGAAGTITGLPSGTASASYAAGVFTFQSATNTPANVDGGSFIFRNNVASSNALTLSPPNAMGSNYTLVLPSIPAQTNVMTLSAAGNMGSVTYDFVGTSMTSVGANSIANARTRTVAANAPMGGVAIGNNSGTFAYSGTGISSAPTTCNLVTSGRPVKIELISTGTPSIVGVSGSGGTSLARFYLFRDSGIIGTYDLQIIGNTETWIPASSISFIDNVGVGTWGYALAMATGASDTGYIFNCAICAYEL